MDEVYIVGKGVENDLQGKKSATGKMPIWDGSSPRKGTLLSRLEG